MNSTLVAIVVGIAAVVGLVVIVLDPWGWRDNDAEKYRLERDNAIVDAAEWKTLYEKEVANRKNCEESKVVRVIETVPVPDQRALQYVMATLREYKDSLEAAKKIAEKLQPSLFSGKENDYLLENRFVKIGLHAYGTHYPLDRKTDLRYYLDTFELLDKQIEYVDKPALPYEWKFFNGFRVRGDLSAQFTPLDIDGEFELSMPLGIVENWRLIPNVGVSTLQDFNAGIGLEWGLFVPQ